MLLINNYNLRTCSIIAVIGTFASIGDTSVYQTIANPKFTERGYGRPPVSAKIFLQNQGK